MVWPSLFADGPDRRYRIARRGIAAVIALRLATRTLTPLADQPDAQFRPPGLLSPLAGAPPAWLLVTLQVMGIAAAAATVVGVGQVVDSRRRGSLSERAGHVVATVGFGAAWAALLFLSAVATSGGKILHNDVLLLLVGLPFSLVPENRVEVAADGSRHPAAPRRNVGWPLELSVALIALAYLMAGVAKLIHTGPSWVFSENMRYVMYWSAQSERPGIPVLTDAIARSSLLAQLTAAGIMGLELAFPLVLVVRRSRPFFAAGAVALHLGTWATLGLDYWGWAATVVLVLIEWRAVSRWASPVEPADPPPETGPGGQPRPTLADESPTREAGDQLV